MKFEWNKKYNTVALYACVTAGIITLVSCLFVNFSGVRDVVSRFFSIISPIIIGLIIAYIINPLFKLFENKVFTFVEKKKPRKALKRTLSLILTYICFAVVIGGFVTFVVPQIAKSYTQLQSKASDYISDVIKWFDGIAGEKGLMRDLYNKIVSFADPEALKKAVTDFIAQSFDLILDSTSVVFGFAIDIFNTIKNAIIGVILSVYFLASKEFLIAQVKKAGRAVFKEKISRKAKHFLIKADGIFGGYIVGTLFDALIVVVIMFVILAILRIPYYPLIAVICGITNMIPFFGPYLGAIPSVFIVLVADPVKAIWLVLVILAVQEVEGNFIAPKIIADHTGLKPFYVIVAITIMGGLFGIIGMFIGVPVFAVFYTIIKDIIENRLKKKGLPRNTSSYMTVHLSDPPVPDEKNESEEEGTEK